MAFNENPKFAASLSERDKFVKKTCTVRWVRCECESEDDKGNNDRWSLIEKEKKKKN